jgi:hypothetical protein
MARLRAADLVLYDALIGERSDSSSANEPAVTR